MPRTIIARAVLKGTAPRCRLPLGASSWDSTPCALRMAIRRGSTLGVVLAGVVLATVSVACRETPAVAGEWLLGSRDSVDYTIELLQGGEAQLREHYFGHDSARQEAVRREDSLARARADSTAPRWFIRRDSLCVLGVGGLTSVSHRCAPYQILDAGGAPVLEVQGERWRRYHTR
jgi:hypothetical protein